MMNPLVVQVAGFGAIAWLIAVILFGVGPQIWNAMVGAKEAQRARQALPHDEESQILEAMMDEEDDDIIVEGTPVNDYGEVDPSAPAAVIDPRGNVQPARSRSQYPLTTADHRLAAKKRQLEGRGASVSRHVTQYLDESQFDARADSFEVRAERMGDTIEQADDRLEARLHQTFDHKVGQLANTSGGTAATRANTEVTSQIAANIVEVLRSPKNAQQAIILSEIINRPENRW